MKPERAERLLQGQTGLARKIMTVVPLQEYWTALQIALELARQDKTMAQQTAVVMGCLNCLKEAGLVRENAAGHFQSLVKPELKMEPKPMAATQVLPKKLSLPDRLFEQAMKLREVASNLDDIALEFTDEIEKASKSGNEKLRLLRELLAEDK